jgi:hypothetical protein
MAKKDVLAECIVQLHQFDYNPQYVFSAVFVD